MQSWRPRTRSQYASRLRALAAYAERTGPPDPAATLAGLLAERAQAGATSSALRGIISAIRAVEDLQRLPPTVTTLHKRIAAGAASSGSQPYLSLAGMVQLVERAKKLPKRDSVRCVGDHQLGVLLAGGRSRWHQSV